MRILGWTLGTAASAATLVWFGGRPWLSDIGLQVFTAAAAIVGAAVGAWPSLRRDRWRPFSAMRQRRLCGKGLVNRDERRGRVA